MDAPRCLHHPDSSLASAQQPTFVLVPVTVPVLRVGPTMQLRRTVPVLGSMWGIEARAPCRDGIWRGRAARLDDLCRALRRTVPGRTATSVEPVAGGIDQLLAGLLGGRARVVGCLLRVRRVFAARVATARTARVATARTTAPGLDVTATVARRSGTVRIARPCLFRPPSVRDRSGRSPRPHPRPARPPRASSRHRRRPHSQTRGRPARGKRPRATPSPARGCLTNDSPIRLSDAPRKSLPDEVVARATTEKQERRLQVR